MADAKRTIELVFEGVDKTGAATQSALNNTQKFAGSVQAATQPIADATFAALKFEAALLTTATAVTGFAVKTAGDFDSAFREISTLLNQPIEDLGEFRQAILDYAGSSTQPLEEITGAIYSAISAGVPLAESIEAVTQAERLAVAGRADLNSSLLVLVSSLNAYGLGMDEAGRFSDALFQAIADGQTNLPELAAGLSQVTGTASTLQVPFETLLAAIAALTKTGTPTAQAITQINAAMNSLLAPSEGAKKLAADLGIEFSAQAVKAQGLEVVLQNVAAATGGNEEQMAKLFGSTEALKAVLPLTGNAARNFSEILVNMANNTGIADQAFAKMAGDISSSTQKVKNAFDVLLVAIGDPLLDEFGGVAESIAAIFSSLGASLQAEDGLGPLLKYIEEVAGEIEDAFAAVAANLPAALEGVDLTKALGGLEDLRNTVADLFDGLDLGTADGLQEVIQRIADGFGNLSSFSAGAIEGLEPLIDIASDVLSKFSEMDSATARANGEAFGFTTTINILSGAVASLLPSLETLLSLFIIGKGGASLVGAFKAGSAALTGAGGLVALPGKAGLVGAAGAAGVGIGTLANEVTELATGKSLSDRLSDWFTSFTDLDDQARDLTTSLGNIPAELEEIVVTAQRISPESFLPSFEEIEKVGEKIGTVFEGVGQAAGGISPILDEVTGKVIGYTDNLGEGTRVSIGFEDALKDSKTSLAGLGQEAENFRNLSESAFVKLEEIASNERIRTFEARIGLDIAEVESAAKVMEAAFESINTSIESTGDLIGSLFGQINEDLNLRDLKRIEDQLGKEEERRQKAFLQQEKLVDAQIANLRARTEAMRRGDALIKVDGAGLQPHLEAFMFEILDAIQVRVNADGEQMLLGLGA